MFIPAWNLWVEMKRTKGGTTSEEQKDWINYLESVGHKAIVAKGYIDGLNQIAILNKKLQLHKTSVNVDN